MKYLDEKLALLNTLLEKENLNRYGLGRVEQGAGRARVQSRMLCLCRVLEALWELLLQAILQALGTNLDVSADFYSRFHFTLEVGPCGGATLCWAAEGKGCCPSPGPRCPRPRCIGLPSLDSSSSNHPPGHCSLPAHLGQ